MGRLCDASSPNTTNKSAVTTQTTLNAGYGFSVVLGCKTERQRSAGAVCGGKPQVIMLLESFSN